MGPTCNSAFRATPGVERKHDYAYYQSIFEWRKGHSVAVGAVARHLAEATFWILSKAEYAVFEYFDR